jgi:hypothetical protein
VTVPFAGSKENGPQVGGPSFQRNRPYEGQRRIAPHWWHKCGPGPWPLRARKEGPARAGPRSNGGGMPFSRDKGAIGSLGRGGERPLRAGPLRGSRLREALRAQAIAASTRLLPSRWWHRTAGPRPKQVLGYLAGASSGGTEGSGGFMAPLRARKASPSFYKARPALQATARLNDRGSSKVVNAIGRGWFQRLASNRLPPVFCVGSAPSERRRPFGWAPGRAARPRGGRNGGHVPRGSTRAGGGWFRDFFTWHLILLFLAKSGAHRTTTDLDWTPWCEDATTLHSLIFLDLIEEEAATLLAPSCRKSHSGARTDVTSRMREVTTLARRGDDVRRVGHKQNAARPD